MWISFGGGPLVMNTGSAISCLKIWEVYEPLLRLSFPISTMEEAIVYDGMWGLL